MSATAKTRSSGAERAGQGAFADWFERLALLLVWAATIALFGYLRPDSFLTWSNFATILGSQSVIVVIALGLIIPLTRATTTFRSPAI